MDVSILEMIAAGGDVATMAFLLVLWRLDRRLVVIETTLLHIPKRTSDED